MGALIRGLTIQQPWAWAIAIGNKPVENRTWRPPEKMLGQYLALHAGKELDTEARAWMARVCGVNAPPDEELRCGAIIAVARLARVTSIADDADTLRGANRWAQGPVCWWLEEVLPVEPIACRGHQGLWELEPETLAALRTEWRAAEEERRRLTGLVRSALALPTVEQQAAVLNGELQRIVRDAQPTPLSRRLAAGPLPRTRCPCGVESRWCGVCGLCQADGHALCEHTRAARAA